MYIRVPHVSAGYLLFCALINRSAVGHGWLCDFFFFALDCHLHLTFQCDRICRPAQGSASSRSKRFLTGKGFEPTHTFVYQNSQLSNFFESGAFDRSTTLPGLCRRFPFWFMSLNWVKFSTEKYNVLNGLCHPFQKICVSTHAYIRVPHVSAGYLLFCALINRSAVGHGWRCDFFLFALDCHLHLTFQCDRICRLKPVSHRVQNVFWEEWDSNPRTHSCTRILDSGISWVWRLRPSAILPGLCRYLSVWSVLFQ